MQGANLIKIIFSLSLILLHLCSPADGIPAMMQRFDQLQPSNELPVYIAVRPMTNGGLVIAKLAMALASSVLTCYFGMLASFFCF